VRQMPGRPLHFSVVTEIIGDDRRVRPNGELDIASRGELDLALTAAEAGGVGDVVLDLRGVSFMDSTGVHAAVEADRRCRAVGKSLRVVPGSERVQRVFRLTGTDALLPFAS
jgi:anti-anti-sigma factor